jgi:uncharacterized pyridoxal phosphate-containing UPF0001 family protein
MPDQMPLLAEAGVGLVGENRLQDLAAKQEAHHDLFEWHFIGALQSRKAPEVAERVALIHSLCTDSALDRFRSAGSRVDALVQVNIAGEEGKAGLDPADLAGFIERCPVRVVGLSTMPPLADDPEHSRTHFRRLAGLAAQHGLAELSMGTSQDWQVAAEEGATIVRLGTTLLG